MYSSYLMKVHPCPLLPLLHFALNSNVPGIGFSFFLKKEFTLLVFSFKEAIDFGTSRNRKNNTMEKQLESSQGGFCCIFLCY